MLKTSSTALFPGIFVSYRREDSSGHAGRLFDNLVKYFGRNRIFMDIDTIEPGEDFVQVIENAVASCDILIVVIGRNWLTRTMGTTDLEDPNDFVRVEIATALDRDIRVIPVLVQRATMPLQRDLPESLARLARRNAIELNDLRWQHDVEQLIKVMDRVLSERESERLASAALDAKTSRQKQVKEEKPRTEADKQYALDEEKKRNVAEEIQRGTEANNARITRLMIIGSIVLLVIIALVFISVNKR